MKVVRVGLNNLVGMDGVPKHIVMGILALLPEDAKFVGSHVDGLNINYLKFESESFKDVMEGQYIPEITPWIRKDAMGDTYVEKIDFNDTLNTDNYKFDGSVTPMVKQSCEHPQWVFYKGLLEVYKYCADCGEKYKP